MGQRLGTDCLEETLNSADVRTSLEGLHSISNHWRQMKSDSCKGMPRTAQHSKSGRQDLNPAWPAGCCRILLRSDRPQQPRRHLAAQCECVWLSTSNCEPLPLPACFGVVGSKRASCRGREWSQC